MSDESNPAYFCFITYAKYLNLCINWKMIISSIGSQKKERRTASIGKSCDTHCYHSNSHSLQLVKVKNQPNQYTYLESIKLKLFVSMLLVIIML